MRDKQQKKVKISKQNVVNNLLCPERVHFVFILAFCRELIAQKLRRQSRERKEKKKTKICSFENLAWEIALCEETELCKTVMTAARGQGGGEGS